MHAVAGSRHAASIPGEISKCGRTVLLSGRTRCPIHVVCRGLPVLIAMERVPALCRKETQ